MLSASLFSPAQHMQSFFHLASKGYHLLQVCLALMKYLCLTQSLSLELMISFSVVSNSQGSNNYIQILISVVGTERWIKILHLFSPSYLIAFSYPLHTPLRPSRLQWQIIVIPCHTKECVLLCACVYVCAERASTCAYSLQVSICVCLKWAQDRRTYAECSKTTFYNICILLLSHITACPQIKRFSRVFQSSVSAVSDRTGTLNFQILFANRMNKTFCLQK